MTDVASELGADHELSAIERDMVRRIESQPRHLPVTDLILHRHCFDCGLPIVRYTPLGTVYEIGQEAPHVCASDPGQLTRCLCGATVRVMMSGRVYDLGNAETAHVCDWTEDLGLRTAIKPAPPQRRSVAGEPTIQRAVVDVPE